MCKRPITDLMAALKQALRTVWLIQEVPAGPYDDASSVLSIHATEEGAEREAAQLVKGSTYDRCDFKVFSMEVESV